MKGNHMNSLFYEEPNPFCLDDDECAIFRKNYDVFLSDLCARDVRNIAIISNQVCEQKGRKYLKIVGLDIFTGKIVSLIDNHGKSYGLCSYSEDWAKLKSKTVIKVPVELCENVFIQECNSHKLRLLNALRTKGKYERLGKTNWHELNCKYSSLYYSSANEEYKLFAKPVNVAKVFELFKSQENLIVHIPVYFSGNHYIKADGSKLKLYNPENEKSFDFISETKKLLDNTGKYLNGIVIAKIIIANGKITVLIDKAINCKYFRYSRNERNYEAFEAQRQYQEQQDMMLIAQCEREADYLYDFLDDIEDNDDDWDKYRPYTSMEEYCDEYEEVHEYAYEYECEYEYDEEFFENDEESFGDEY